jgi:DNA-binding GntR family transcriptional regulator
MLCAIENSTKPSPSNPAIPAFIETLARFALQIQLCGTIASRECVEGAAYGCDDIIQAFKARDTSRAAFLVRAHISHMQQLILARLPNEIASCMP